MRHATAEAVVSAWSQQVEELDWEDVTERVLRAIEVQLTHEPLRETRNRKPLRPNPVAPWELRVGQLRVFYDVAEGPPPTVQVLAVGVKDRAVLRIGGLEVQL